MIYYKRIARDTWIKSARPNKTGTWISEEAYRIQCMIEHEQTQAKSRYTRRTVRRKLRSE